jgi:hypothetical protein
VTVLEQLAQRLHGTTSGTEVAGTCHGVAVTVRHIDHGDESHADMWTEIEAEVPVVPLTLFVRHHVPQDVVDCGDGVMIDVRVGDPEFDGIFLVEGAPSRVVTRLLDRPAKDFLIGHRHLSLSCHVREPNVAWRSRYDAFLQVRVRGNKETLEHSFHLIEFLVRLAQRVPEAVAAAAAERAAAGGPYRPGLSETSPRDTAADEIAAVRVVQTYRALHGARPARKASIGLRRAMIAFQVMSFLVLGLLVVFLLR